MAFTAGGSQGPPAFFAMSWSFRSWNAQSISNPITPNKSKTSAHRDRRWRRSYRRNRAATESHNIVARLASRPRSPRSLE